MVCRMNAIPQSREGLCAAERLGVVRAEDPVLIGQQRFEGGTRLFPLPPVQQRKGHGASTQQCVRVVGAQHADPVGQQIFETRTSLFQFACLHQREPQDVSSDESVRVVGAQHPDLIRE